MRTLVSGALTISLVMALAGVGLTTMPVWRRHAVEIMPIVLAATSFAVGSYFVVSQDLAVGVFLWGLTNHHWIGFLAGLAVGMLLGGAAFWLEAQATLRWYSSRVGRDMYFLYVPVAGRSETMTGVAELAQRIRPFVALSVLSASGEEFFYRGVFLLGGISTNQGDAIALLIVQAVLYGINHVAFGFPAVVGKSLFGISLGGVALLGGVPASFLAHLFYQVLVWRQFRAKKEIRL